MNLQILEDIKQISIKYPKLTFGKIISTIINLEYLSEISDDRLLKILKDIYDT